MGEHKPLRSSYKRGNWDIGCIPWFVVALVVGGIGLLIFQEARAWLNDKELERIRAELPDAITRWNNAGIVDYDVDIKGDGTLECLSFNVTLSVRDGKVLEFRPISAAKGGFFGMGNLCPPQRFLFRRVFGEVGYSLSSIKPNAGRLYVAFDPEYGFVSEFSVTRYSLTMGECCFRYTFTNFRPVQVEQSSP